MSPGLGNDAFTWAWAKAFTANPASSRDDLITQVRALLANGLWTKQTQQLECDAAAGAAKVGE